MILYSVTITLDPQVEVEWSDWMTRVHIPEVLQTGCFLKCEVFKVVEPDGPEPVFVMQYHCATLADYHRYRDNFAAALQQEHSNRFTGRFRASRQILEQQ